MVPTPSSDPAHEPYGIEKSLLKETNSEFFEATHSQNPGQSLACRIYESGKIEDPPNSLYLKTLKHLGKKHASIAHTWDIFDNAGKIEVFCEWCANGNLQDYMEKQGSLDETEATLYAYHLLRGMDFLGDIGIAHRDIQPKNLVLRPCNPMNQLKIAEFKDSIIYWSSEENDVVMVACRPADHQKKDGKNFQAP